MVSDTGRVVVDLVTSSIRQFRITETDAAPSVYRAPDSCRTRAGAAPSVSPAAHSLHVFVQTDAMARAGAVYEVVNSTTGEVLSRHRTRQAAVDTWRTQFTGVPIQVWRRTVPKGEMLIVEGT
jgi:hypothetical protein